MCLIITNLLNFHPEKKHKTNYISAKNKIRNPQIFPQKVLTFAESFYKTSLSRTRC